MTEVKNGMDRPALKPKSWAKNTRDKTSFS